MPLKIENTVVIEQIEIIRITARNKYTWARVDLDGKTGLVSITSDYGNWSHYWTAIGDLSLTAFCAKINRDYVAGKMMGSSRSVIDIDKTKHAIRKRILELRREGSFCATTARTEWHASDFINEGEYQTFLHHTEICEAWEYRCSMENPTWTNFWDRLWVPFIQPALFEIIEGEEP